MTKFVVNLLIILKIMKLSNNQWKVNSEWMGGRVQREIQPESLQKTESGQWNCISYLILSVLAERIEGFSIYANHWHRHRIITALCQESSLPNQSLLYLFSHHGEIPLYIYNFPLPHFWVCLCISGPCHWINENWRRHKCGFTPALQADDKWLATIVGKLNN